MYIFLPKPIPTHKHIASNWITIIEDERIIHGKRYKRIMHIFVFLYVVNVKGLEWLNLFFN